MIQIQAILSKSSFKSQYWMKKDDEKSKRINKKEWFKLYDKIGIEDIEILPPLTKEK